MDGDRGQTICGETIAQEGSFLGTTTLAKNEQIGGGNLKARYH